MLLFDGLQHLSVLNVCSYGFTARVFCCKHMAHWCKLSNVPSIWGLIVDEKRMRPVHCFGRVLCVFFSDMIFGGGECRIHKKDTQPLKKPVPFIPKGSIPYQWRKKPRGKLANPGLFGKRNKH